MDQISQSNLTDKKLVECSPNKVSVETELSETLYDTMKDFVLSNPTWDQYKLINSALATFLFQNGCTDNSVSEIYLNQLFTPCLLYTSPSPRDRTRSRMPSSA